MAGEKTTYYGLPQYGPHDHPDFLTEINEAYRTIDTELNRLSTLAESNSKLITAAMETIEALSTQVSLLSDRVASIEKKGVEE